MASPIHADLQSAQEQLTEIVSAVTRVQGSLADITRRSEEETRAAWQRLEELEAELTYNKGEMAGLHGLNQDLRREVDESKDIGLEKLQEAKRVMIAKLRGMMSALDTVLMDLTAEDEGIPPSSKGKGKQRAREDSRSFLEPRIGTRTPSSPDSSATIRPTKKSPSTRGSDARKGLWRGNLQAGPSGTRERSSESEEGSKAPKTQAISRVSKSPGETVKATSSGSSSASVKADWNIHYSQPPHAIACGSPAIQWANLADRLRLSEKKMSELHRLSTLDMIRMPIRIFRASQAAFVYSSIKLEGPSGSYLIDWTQEQGGRLQTERYVTDGGRPEDPVYHTFLYETKKEHVGWYYFGAMSWTPKPDIMPLWPTLSDRSKAKLAARLSDRTSNLKRGRQEISKAMDEGRLEQICFQIDGKPYAASSRDFMREIGFSSNIGERSSG